MHGVAQLVRHGRDVLRAALEVEQHPRGQLRQDGGAEGAAAFAFAHFTVDMLVSEHTLGFGCKFVIKALISLKGQLSSLCKAIFFAGAGNRCVNIIAAQLLHA